MYKYMEKRFVDQLLTMGGLRIGTLHDFRSTEHKRGIVDVDEGKKSISHHIKGLHVVDSEAEENDKNLDFRALSEFNAISLQNCKNVVIKNVSVSKRIDSPNFFVFCTSSTRSRKTMREFDGADSCFEIHDPNNFYRLLTDTLSKVVPVHFLGVHQVTYKDREEIWNGVDWGRHPALIKHPDYSCQSEIRAIWQPLLDHEIAPVITGHWRLGAFCRMACL